MYTLKFFLYTAITCLMGSALEAAGTAELPAVGTVGKVGKVNGLEIEVVVQGPAGQKTPLQVACLFEYTEGDIYKSPPALPRELNGMVHVDEALNGLITDLRKSNRFRGHLLETLLITPPPGSLAADKLLLLGLGNRNDFNADSMRLVGITGMREALRLGVTSYAHASDIKDAGIDSPTAEVAANVVQGALEAYRTQCFLKWKQASEEPSVCRVTVLAGPAYFEDSKKGIRDAIQQYLPPNRQQYTPPK